MNENSIYFQQNLTYSFRLFSLAAPPDTLKSSIQMSESHYAVFSHLQGERVALYRAIMRTFMQAREEFRMYLRPDEVLSGLHTQGLTELPDEKLLAACLTQLCSWHNLEVQLDTSAVSTVEDYLRRRYLYQLTHQGEAAERALLQFEVHLTQAGELQATALSDIRTCLSELLGLSEQLELDEQDERQAFRTMDTLWRSLDELTQRARTFLRSLENPVGLLSLEFRVFLEYKDRLVDYLERFVKELLNETYEISLQLLAFDPAGVERLLSAIVNRELADSLNAGEQERADALKRWQGRWQGLSSWFLGESGRPSQAELLRSHARSAIPLSCPGCARAGQPPACTGRAGREAGRAHP